MMNKMILSLSLMAGMMLAAGAAPELAWEQANNEQRCTLCYAYGVRGEGDKLAAHLQDANADVAKAAALALGRLGNAKALAALTALKPSANPAVADARNCAIAAALGQFARRGDAKSAAAVARKFYDNAAAPDFLRAAAARVLVKADAAFFKTAVADKTKFVRESAVMSADSVPAATLAEVLAQTQCPELKVQLLSRIAANKATAASAAVVKLVKDQDEAVAAAAVNTLAVIGGDNLVAVFAEARSRGGKVQSAADTALAEMGGIGEQILAFAAKDAAFIKVAADRGEMKLLPKWAPLVAAADKEMRKTAWRTLGKIAGETEVATLMGWYGKVGADEAEVATAAMGRVLRRLSGPARDRALAEFFAAAPANVRGQVEEQVWEQKGIEAFALWEGLAQKCPAAKAAYVKYAAKLAADVNFVKVDKSKWTASANRDGGNVRNAIDGNPATRWTSGENSKDAAFILNFGAPLYVAEVTLDTKASPKDTPYGCDVFASDDGKNWKKVASCDENSVESTTFKIGATTRQLKFVNLQVRPRLYWSIHEIIVKTEVDKQLLEKIAATAKSFEAK